MYHFIEKCHDVTNLAYLMNLLYPVGVQRHNIFWFKSRISRGCRSQKSGPTIILKTQQLQSEDPISTNKGPTNTQNKDLQKTLLQTKTHKTKNPLLPNKDPTTTKWRHPTTTTTLFCSSEVFGLLLGVRVVLGVLILLLGLIWQQCGLRFAGLCL
jgi:hypothetical protein